MYLYIFKNRRFVDRMFVNSSEVDDCKFEIEEKNGEGTEIIASSEFFDSPSFEELCYMLT